MKTLILTGCDAAMSSVGDLTAPIMARYALRHGYAFERVTSYETGTHPSWQKLRLIRERLPKFDAILWLDADTVITNPLIGASVRTAGPGLTVSMDWTGPAPEDAVKHFSLGNFVFTNCPGSFEVVERASKRTEWANAPLWEQQAIQEEYRAFTGAESIRPHVHIFPRRHLNAVPALPHTSGPEPWEHGDFLCHLTFTGNAERVKLIPGYERAGLDAVAGGLPNWHETGMCMDVRHIAILRDILRLGKPRRALEIGVWRGSASSAFLSALSDRDIQEYSACDVGFTMEFDAIAGTRAVRHHCRSTELLAKSAASRWNLILVDGDHSAETGRAEAAELIRMQVPCILGHDSRSAEGDFPNCEGPAILMEALRADGYAITEDAIDRHGEMTRRGFFAATKDPAIQEAIALAFSLNT